VQADLKGLRAADGLIDSENTGLIHLLARFKIKSSFSERSRGPESCLFLINSDQIRKVERYSGSGGCTMPVKMLSFLLKSRLGNGIKDRKNKPAPLISKNHG
jgi:hypothetical protein